MEDFENIPMVDLKSQYLSIKDQIDQSVISTIESSQFIGGSQVESFKISSLKVNTYPETYTECNLLFLSISTNIGFKPDWTIGHSDVDQHKLGIIISSPIFNLFFL